PPGDSPPEPLSAPAEAAAPQDPNDFYTLELEPPTFEATLDAALPAALADPTPTTPIVSAAEPTGDHALGDTDLVDLVLRGQGGLSGLALRMIRAQANLPELTLAPLDQSFPDHHAAAPVVQDDHHFGHLHTPIPAPYHGATEARLQTWADWLVRWLRLEAQFSRLRDLAMRDELTGAWNRRYFNHFLKKIVDRAAEDRQQVTLMVFDIDDFKSYNDAYGHAAGDEILRGVAQLMRDCVRAHDVVARIGGDEFAVIFWDAGQRRKPDSKHPNDVLNAAKRFQRAVIDHRFPKLLDKAAGNLTISGGLAGFPWDGRSPHELLEFADALAMRSKQPGKNAITFGPGVAPPAPATPPGTPPRKGL
ncbi:MAG: GGDEF domain-containing protein, partial [Planctomycetota bacterium]